MLFHVTMSVSIPHGLDPDYIDGLKRTEKTRCQELMAAGAWRHIWRVVGQYKNVSIFDVSSPAELHDILTSLPLFPFMEIAVTPICRHPSSTRDDDR
jgi:muconolactone D-isomerase